MQFVPNPNAVSSAPAASPWGDSGNSGLLAYRPDIDGLRAVAVTAAVLFHTGFAVLPGGFVGVEIFFVLSGYLITSQLLLLMERGRFSFAAFYERRVRRLLPAIVPVLLFVAGLSLWRLSPRELMDVSDSMLSVSLFSSNLYFMGQDSYFNGTALLTPLLHTWSLSVEEQYYLLFPALLLFVHRFAKRWIVGTIASILVLSLAFSIAAVALGWMNVAFYHPFSRFWELMVGSLLAATSLRPRLSYAMATVVCTICFVALLTCLYFVGSTTPFPGALALVPTLATAGIILCGEQHATPVGRLLAMRVPVFIGKISYSLYLWHWPLLALLTIWGAEANPWAVTCVVLLGVGVASLSYFYVENPFRGRGIVKTRRPVFAALVVSIVAFSSAGLAMRMLDGLPQRFPLDIARYAQQVELQRNWAHFRYHTCFKGFTDTEENFEEKGCLAIDPGRKNVLIFGDSHAAQLYYGLQQRFPEVNFLQVTSFSCYPLFDVRDASKICRESNEKVLQHWLQANRIDGLILAALWEDGRHIDQLLGDLSRYEALVPHVALAGPSLRLEHTMTPMQIVTRYKHLDGAQQEINKHLRPEIFRADRRLAQALAGHAVRYVSLTDLLCQDEDCRQFDDGGAPLMMDNNHITVEGSVFMAPAFDMFIRGDVLGEARAGVPAH